jgi:hypothetical protein
MVKNGDVFKREWGELGLMPAVTAAKPPFAAGPQSWLLSLRATPFPFHPDERPLQ